MSKQIINKVKDALGKWEYWNDLGAKARADILLRWSASISAEVVLGESSASMVDHQIKQGLPLIADEKLMPGPTGESNHLYTSGRGLFVVCGSESAPATAFIGMITTALLAGNCIILSLPESKYVVAEKILSTLLKSGLPKEVVNIANSDAAQALINDIATAGVLFAGESAEAIEINQQLASRKGLLAQLISETDISLLSHITDSYFILRFITEKTRTINISAIGGNAELLALGAGDS